MQLFYYSNLKRIHNHNGNLINYFSILEKSRTTLKTGYLSSIGISNFLEINHFDLGKKKTIHFVFKSVGKA